MSFKIVILGSGRGSNAKALLEAEQSGVLGSVETVAILSDIPDAPILNLAKKFKKPGHCIPKAGKKARLNDDEETAFVEKILGYHPDLVVLAGFMRILDKSFIDALNGKVINLHPSLLPSFPGIDSIKQAFDYGVTITGCTVHWVTPALDAGPIINQASVEINSEDTLNSLTEKVHRAEHKLLPSVIRKLSEQASEQG